MSTNTTKMFVNMKKWKKSRYMLPKTAFVLATFCMLYMAYKPASVKMSNAGLSGLSEQSLYDQVYDANLQSPFQRHLMSEMSVSDSAG